MIANAQREVTNQNATALKKVTNMPTYTTPPHSCQIPVDTTWGQPNPPDPYQMLSLDDEVEVLSLDDEAEVTAPFWRERTVEPADDRIARWAILHAYENGAIGAVEAFNALDARSLFGDFDDFMTAYCAGVRAVEDGGE